MLFDKYKKFWEEGDIEAFTSIIHADIENYHAFNCGVIDYDLWMERISAVVLSDAYAENIRCLYENDDIMSSFIRLLTQQMDSRDAFMYVFTKEDGMLTRLETGATPLQANDEAF